MKEMNAVTISKGCDSSSLPGLVPKRKTKNQGNDFLRALEEKDALAVWNLLESDADPQSPFQTTSKDWFLPLQYAIGCQLNYIAELLVAYSADLNAVDVKHQDQWSALHWATYVKNETGLKLLLDNGADSSVQDPRMRTPLFTAAQYGDIQGARILLERGASIDIPNCHGDYPIHAAARYGCPELVDLFLDHGVETNKKGIYENTPFHSAAERGCLRSMRMLIKRGAKWNQGNHIGTKAFAFAAGGPAEHETDQLLAAAFILGLEDDINQANRNGTTPLHRAVCAQKAKTVKWLLELGADCAKSSTCKLAFGDQAGKQMKGTPLQMAQELGHTDIVNLLENHLGSKE